MNNKIVDAFRKLIDINTPIIYIMIMILFVWMKS